MIRIAAALFRVKLSLFNGCTALTGYLLFPSPVNVVSAAAVFAGVTLMAGGGSAINQAMEHELDARMLRTCNRPIPREQLSPRSSFIVGGAVALTGFVLLIFICGTAAALLGAVALAWYLAVYTPLKTRTPLSLPIGAMCGAFPPLIGWSTAGGSLSDYRIISLAILLFLWQVPHFWLLQRRCEDDYRRAGVPSLASQLSVAITAETCFRLWLGAFCSAALLLPTLGIITGSAAIVCALFPVPIALLAMFRSERKLFSLINSYPLLILGMLVIQKYSLY